MSIWSRIKSWFTKPSKPTHKPTVALMVNEISTPGSRTQWGVDIVINGKVHSTHWFNKKPTKKQREQLLNSHK